MGDNDTLLGENSQSVASVTLGLILTLWFDEWNEMITALLVIINKYYCTLKIIKNLRTLSVDSRENMQWIMSIR